MELIFYEGCFPARLRFPKPMNDRELMHFCADNRDLRIKQESDGDLSVLLPTTSDCGSIELEVSFQLHSWARTNGHGRAFGAGVGFRLPDGSVRAANAVWISSDCWNGFGETQRDGYAPLCPEFVVEVRSELDHLSRMTSKMETWIANGAELGWLIDDELETVTVYRRHGVTEIQGGSSR